VENKNVIKFAKEIGKLKSLERTGWKVRGVKNPESVADHSFRATILGMLLSDLEGLDTEKIIRMLLLHDIQEAISGDITSVDKEKMPDNGKSIEEKSIKNILSYLPDDLKKKYLYLWKEMEEVVTKEAKFCKDVDKLEKMIQLREYEDEQPDRKNVLKVFWDREKLNAPKNISSLIKVYEELKKQRGSK